MWYHNDPLGGNSNILHGFLLPNITCPLQALKQRLETESTFFQRLQLDRVGEGPGHGELGGSLAKTKKKLAILQGKMVETDNQDWSTMGFWDYVTPQRCFWVANEQRFRLGDVLILLTFYYKNAMKSCFEAWNLGCTVIQMEEIWEGLFLTLGFFWTSLTRPTLQLLDQDKLPAIEDILLSHLPASTLVAERLWIVCSILADISNMSYSMKEFRVSSSVFFRI